MDKKTIYCTACGKDVEARLTNGAERYSHREDLYEIPFWKCDTCGNYVGCHHKSNDPTRPLGVIASKPIVEMRKKIHAKLDPIWMSGKLSRRFLYGRITKELGYEYHTAGIRSLPEAKKIYDIVSRINNQQNQRPTQ